MVITRSLLPRIWGKPPLPLFGGDFYGNVAQFYYTKLQLKTFQLLPFPLFMVNYHILPLNYHILHLQKVIQNYHFP